jgi:hypothetical protein
MAEPSEKMVAVLVSAACQYGCKNGKADGKNGQKVATDSQKHVTETEVVLARSIISSE